MLTRTVPHIHYAIFHVIIFIFCFISLPMKWRFPSYFPFFFFFIKTYIGRCNAECSAHLGMIFDGHDEQTHVHYNEWSTIAIIRNLLEMNEMR